MALEIQLDGQSDTPLYRQLFEQVRDLILSGHFPDGHRLPPTRELAGLLGLNRATVASAYTLLEKTGHIKGHVGRGSFVTAPNANPAGARDWSSLFAGPPAQRQQPATAGELISFATSRPSEDLFPLDQFRRLASEVLASPALAGILQLGSPLGYEPLRHALLHRARCAGVARDSDDILITNGCQQALDLLQRVFVQTGDSAAIEDPVYPGLQQVLRRAGARLLGIPVAADGVDLDALETILQREHPKLLVLTPNFQNPTGATIPMSAREAIVRLARQSGAIVVESDIYSELRYDGPPLPPIKQLDDSGDSILLGSFSKVAFPGLRVGWVLAPREVVARLAEAKQWTDLHSDQLAQAVLARFLDSGGLEEHLGRVVAAGAACRDAALESCATTFPLGAEFTRPRGGMNLWLRLPGGLDADALLVRAQARGVGFLPGRYFAVSRPEPCALRLSFAGLKPAEIRRGISILGGIVTEELVHRHDAGRFEPAVAMV